MVFFVLVIVLYYGNAEKCNFGKIHTSQKREFKLLLHFFLQRDTSFWKLSRRKTSLMFAVGWKNESEPQPTNKKYTHICLYQRDAMMQYSIFVWKIWGRNHIKLFAFSCLCTTKNISIHSCHHTAKIPFSVSLKKYIFYIYDFVLFIFNLSSERKIWQRTPIKYVGISLSKTESQKRNKLKDITRYILRKLNF